MPDLFTMKFIVNTNINHNKKLNQLTILEIITEALNEKYKNEKKKISAKLNLIKDLVDPNLLYLKFCQFYQQVYLNSKECKEKLAKVIKNYSQEYIMKYKYCLNHYVSYYKETQANKYIRSKIYQKKKIRLYEKNYR